MDTNTCSKDILKRIALSLFGEQTKGNVSKAAYLLVRVLCIMLEDNGEWNRRNLLRSIVSHGVDAEHAEAVLYALRMEHIITERPVGSEGTCVGTVVSCAESSVRNLLRSVAGIVTGMPLDVLVDAVVVESDALIHKASELTQAHVSWSLSFGHDGRDETGCRHYVLISWNEGGEKNQLVVHDLNTMDLNVLVDELLGIYCSQRPSG